MQKPKSFMYQRSGKTFGPVGPAELRRLAQCGELQPSDLVRTTEMHKWVTASVVKGLFGTPNLPNAADSSPKTTSDRHADANPVVKPAGAATPKAPQAPITGMPANASAPEIRMPEGAPATPPAPPLPPPARPNVPAPRAAAAPTRDPEALHHRLAPLHRLAGWLKQESVLVAHATWEQTLRFSGFVAVSGRAFRTRADVTDAYARLGRRLHELGKGNPEVGGQLDAINNEIREQKAANASVSKLESKKSALAVQLAELWLNQEASPEGVEAELQAVQRARDVMEQQKHDVTSQKAGLLSPDRESNVRMIIGFSSVAFVVLATAWMLWPGRSNPWESYMAEASSFQRNWQEQQAREEAEKKEKEQAKLAQVRTLVERGDAMREKGKLLEAIEIYQEAFEIDPDTATSYNGKGLVSMILEQWDDAIEFFDNAVYQDDKFAFGYVNRARCKIKLEQFDAAIRDLGEAIQIDPSNAEFYGYRALAHRKKNDRTAALRDIASAIRLDDTLAMPYLNRGAIRAQNEEDLEGAIQDYTAALRRDKTLKMGYLQRGTAYVTQGKHELAINDFSQAIGIDPKLTAGYYNRALVYAQRQKHSQAVKDFSSVLRLSNKDDNDFRTKTYFARGEAFLEMDKFAEAKEDFSRVIGQNGDYSLAYQYRALAKKGLKDPTAADDLAKAVALRESPRRDRVVPWQSPRSSVYSSQVAAQMSAYRNQAKANQYRQQADYYRQRAMSEAYQQTQRSMRNYQSQMSGQLGAMGLQFDYR